MTSQGSFSPESLHSNVWSRRFVKQQSDGLYTVVTVEAAVVQDQGQEDFYVFEIVETCEDEKDPDDIGGDYSDYEYNSNVYPTNFDNVGEAESEAKRYIQSLDARCF